MVPKFEEYQEGIGAELLCPSCGNNNLHHGEVQVFECEEDAEHGVHVTVADGKATMDTSLKGNPSARRHGMTIVFSCEHCKATPALSIKQHKGITYIDFT